MLSNDRKHILLMNPVRPDFKLSKFKKDKELSNAAMQGTFGGVMDQIPLFDDGGGLFRSQNINVWDGIPFEVRRQIDSPTRRAIASLYIKFRMLFNSDKMVPNEFFDSVKQSFSELLPEVLSDNDLTFILSELENSKQSWISGKILSANVVAHNEKLIKDSGFTRYQTEKSIIEFILKSKKGLCLEEIQYFKYEIPKDVSEIIDKADKLKVFDNFYILHYDPNHEYNIFYEKEKDPIVFGVFNGSDKLYYIADWVSDYCDLTYAKLLEGNKKNDFKL